MFLVKLAAFSVLHISTGSSGMRRDRLLSNYLTLPTWKPRTALWIPYIPFHHFVTNSTWQLIFRLLQLWKCGLTSPDLCGTVLVWSWLSHTHGDKTHIYRILFCFVVNTYCSGNDHRISIVSVGNGRVNPLTSIVWLLGIPVSIMAGRLCSNASRNGAFHIRCSANHRKSPAANFEYFMNSDPES